MVKQPQVKPASAGTMPVVRRIGLADIRAAFVAGVGDFFRAPLFGLFFGGFYALGGLLVVALIARLDMHYMIYPLAIGFPLVGPFVAVGIYEVSRCLQDGRPLTWSGVLTTVWRQKGRELSIMAFVTLFIMWMWMYQVRLLVALFLGFRSFSTLDGFIHTVLNTGDGLRFLAAGHIVGGILYTVLFSVTVVSIPLLLDREVDFVTAIITSIKAVLTNPFAMMVWGLVVLVLTALALVPAFLGLFIILPVLGHATWHLYLRVVEPASN
ncbi:DUF2189 domain-containing protein [Anderseniella sp. Alg231-50]|uniref:DUF2189 domain-containing protein n=1 Tax=Anderseniella sp. Alg231-50 TaxID=1922226 RepID=UPI000D556DA7